MNLLLLALSVPLGIVDAVRIRADRALCRLGRRAGDDAVVYDLTGGGS